MAQSRRAHTPSSAHILLGRLSPISTGIELACSMEAGSMKEITLGRK
jgi:hypothetical protein